MYVLCGHYHSIQCKEEMQLQQLTSDYKGEECVNVCNFFLKRIALISATIDGNIISMALQL